MSHYSCKDCGLRYDDCRCPKTKPVPILIPDDGKHWKSNKASSFPKCVNCGKGYIQHLFNQDSYSCIPSKKTTELDESLVRKLTKDYFGNIPKAMEDAYVEFARMVEKEVRRGDRR